MPALQPPLTAEQRARAASRIPSPVPPRRPPLTVGRLYYLCFHASRRWLPPHTSGRFQRWKRNRTRWRRAGRLQFPAIATLGHETLLAPHYLTGIDYLPQTLFAIKSWGKFSGLPVRPRVFDDGSLTAHDVQWLRDRVPGIDVVEHSDIMRTLDAHLPAEKFPLLRRLRLGYPHLRKLTDIHAGRSGWTLVSDADVLVFKHPSELLAHLAAPRAFFLRDCQQSYGVPLAFLEKLAARPVPPLVNCGLYHVRSESIDWEFAEYAAGRFLSEHGFSFYLEQALSALVLGAASAVELGPDYVVYPRGEEARTPTKTLLHYLQGGDNPEMEFAWRLLEDDARA